MKIKTLELNATGVLSKALWDVYQEEKIDCETYVKVNQLLSKFIRVNAMFNNTDEMFVYEVNHEGR